MRAQLFLNKEIFWIILMAAIGYIAISWAISELSQVEPAGGDYGGGGGEWGEFYVVFSKAEHKVTEQQITAYLRDNAGDRLKGSGHIFYSLGVQYDIDPAFAVAVSQKETNLGKDTCQGISQSCNNFFCMMYSAAEPTGLVNGKCTGTDRDWASFESIEKCIEAFYKYIKTYYVEAEHAQLPSGETQDTIAKIGCGPGTGLTSHCYCWDNERNTYCQTWVGGSGSVPYYVSETRNYEA